MVLAWRAEKFLMASDAREICFRMDQDVNLIDHHDHARNWYKPTWCSP
jgi:hypothetical protein